MEKGQIELFQILYSLEPTWCAEEHFFKETHRLQSLTDIMVGIQIFFSQSWAYIILKYNLQNFKNGDSGFFLYHFVLQNLVVNTHSIFVTVVRSFSITHRTSGWTACQEIGMDKYKIHWNKLWNLVTIYGLTYWSILQRVQPPWFNFTPIHEPE